MQEKVFEQRTANTQVVVSAAELMISSGWTINIPREKAIQYIQNYNTDVNNGFWEHGGLVILTYGPGKITFKHTQAAEIIQMIKKEYGI